MQIAVPQAQKKHFVAIFCCCHIFQPHFRSITRPSYDELNPAPRYVDQYTYDVGNQYLQPQFTNNFEINATYNDFPVFAIGVNNTQDVFSMVTYKNDNSRRVRSFKY